VKYFLSTTISLIVFMFFGCASYSPIITDKNVGESQIEIHHSLGHNQYMFLAKAQNQKAEVSTFRDSQLVETKTIPLENYVTFIRKIEKTLETSGETHDPTKECRTPYKIVVTAHQKVRTLSGCRSNEHKSMIGDILKEGEFLFYSAPAPSETE
jgi:hypothetical protein